MLYLPVDKVNPAQGMYPNRHNKIKHNKVLYMSTILCSMNSFRYAFTCHSEMFSIFMSFDSE